MPSRSPGEAAGGSIKSAQPGDRAGVSGDSVLAAGVATASAGHYMYAGKCTGADYFHRLASRKSKMFFGRSKSCPSAFQYRQGTNCFVCRPGHYWSNGGCVGRCPGGTDLANRKCR